MFQFSSLKTLSMNTIIAAIIAVVCVGGLCVYFAYPSWFSQIEGYTPNNEHNTGAQSTNKTAELLLFAADWCPHCKQAKPIWEEMKANFDGKQLNGYNVMFTEYDCSETTAEIAPIIDKYNVEGYPTIKLLINGNVINFEGKPTVDSLTQFLNITTGNAS